MKCISLWQPWASAITARIKRVETRGWSTSVRGRIAIHAAKHWAKPEREFYSARLRAGDQLPELPFGAIIGTAVLVEVEPAMSLVGKGLGDLEMMYGNYDEGRFGWLLEDVFALPEPIAFKGAQGFFNVPDELLPEAARAPARPRASLNPQLAWPFPVSAHVE